MPTYLSTAEAAAALGLTDSTVRTYLAKGKMAEPDIRIGQVPGWLPDTIEAYRQTLSGAGARTDLPPVRAALAVDAFGIRRLCAGEAGQLDGVRSPRGGHGPATAHATALAQRMHEKAPWVALAAELGEGFAEEDGPLDETQQAFVTGVTARHLLSAQRELGDFAWPRRSGDWHGVAQGASAMLRHAGLLRFVALLTGDNSG